MSQANFLYDKLFDDDEMAEPDAKKVHHKARPSITDTLSLQ